MENPLRPGQEHLESGTPTAPTLCDYRAKCQVLINGILGKWDFGEKLVSEKVTYQELLLPMVADGLLFR